MRSDVLALINTDDLVHNYHALRARCGPNVKLCAPLKADAYGHGLHIVAPVLYRAGADSAAVATLTEAVELRGQGWDRPILVLGNVLAVQDESEVRERLQLVLKYDITLTLADERSLVLLSSLNDHKGVSVHLKIDSGMGRMGVMPDEASKLLDGILRTPQVRLVGVYSHFATADFQNLEKARAQLATFRDLMALFKPRLPAGSIRHLANSAATITMPEAHFDMIRPGLALYGYAPSRHMQSVIDLRPVLRLVSHVTLLKSLPAGHCVGYGVTYSTNRPTRLGIIPIGYSDGYVRTLSNAAVVGTRHGDVPVVGRVSMDQMAVDLTDRPEVRAGDEVVLLDNRMDRPNSVQSIAESLGTIPYEVTCLLGRRIERRGLGNYCATNPS